MRVLVLTKIFPNRVEPFSNPFNRQQFAALSSFCDVQVLATIPWFPGAGFFGKWSHAGKLAGVPRGDVIDGLKVTHPRYLFVPRLVSLTAPLYLGSLLLPVALRRKQFDVILGSWAYPDGVAAVKLGRLLSMPSVVKLHGSDVNVLGALPGPRARLAADLPRADRVVAVSRALADEAVKLGVDRARIEVVQNGVDASLFQPRSKKEARAKLGRDDGEELILYVGRLEEAKGAHDLLAAFALLSAKRPSAKLVFVGDGKSRGKLELDARPLGSSVTFAGTRPLDDVTRWMAAADLVTLPSWAEGTPNVILEAQASGRPVVATRVGGIPDLVTSARLGELVPAREPSQLAAALGRVLDGVREGRHPEQAIADEAGRTGWQESARKLHAVLQRAMERA